MQCFALNTGVRDGAGVWDGPGDEDWWVLGRRKRASLGERIEWGNQS